MRDRTPHPGLLRASRGAVCGPARPTFHRTPWRGALAAAFTTLVLGPVVVSGLATPATAGEFAALHLEMGDPSTLDATSEATSEARLAGLAADLSGDLSGGVRDLRLENGVRVIIAPSETPQDRVLTPEAGAAWLVVDAGAIDEQGPMRQPGADAPPIGGEIGAASILSKFATRLALASPADESGETFAAQLADFGIRERDGLGAYSGLDHGAVFLRMTPSEAGMRTSLRFLSRTVEVARGESSWLDRGNADRGEVDPGERASWDAKRDEVWRTAGAELTAYASGQISDYQRTMQRVFAGSRLGSRWPVPTHAQLDALTPEAAHAFGRRAFAPGSITLIMVGVRDVEQAERLVREHFDARQPGAAPAPGDVPDAAPAYPIVPEPTRGVVVVRSTAARADEVGMIRARPHPLVPNTPREDAIERLARAVLSSRVDAAVRRGVVPSAEAKAVGWMPTGPVDLAQVVTSGEAGSWPELVSALGEVAGSVRAEPVTRAEVLGVRSEVLARVWSNEVLGFQGLTGGLARAAQLADLARGGRPLWEGSAGARAAEAALGSALREPGIEGEVWQAVRDMVRPEGITLVVRGPLEGIATDESKLTASAQAAFERGVERGGSRSLRTEGRFDPTLAEDTHKPALPVLVTRDAATGVTSVALDNGIRVLHKRFAGSGSVQVRVCLWGGEIEETALTRGFTSAAGEAMRAEAAWVSPAISGAVGEGVWVEVEPASIVSGIETRADVPGSTRHALAALRRVFDTPGPSADDADRWRRARTVERARERSDAVRLAIHVAQEIGRPADRPAARAFGADREDATTGADARAWLEAVRARGPITVVIVGDIEAEESIALVGSAFAGVRDREAAEQDWLSARRELAGGAWWRADETVRTSSPDGVACVVAGAGGVDHTNVRTVRALALGADLVERRVQARLRAELDAGDRAHATTKLDRVYAGHSRVLVLVRTRSDRADRAREIIEQELIRLTREPPTDRAWDEVRAQAMAGVQRSLAGPATWAGRLSSTCWDVEGVLREMATLASDYESLTPTDVQQAWASAAARGLLRVTALPEESPDAQ